MLEGRQPAATHVETTSLQMQIRVAHPAVGNAHRHFMSDRCRERVLLRDESPAPGVKRPAMCTLIFFMNPPVVIAPPGARLVRTRRRRLCRWQFESALFRSQSSGANISRCSISTSSLAPPCGLASAWHGNC